MRIFKFKCRVKFLNCIRHVARKLGEFQLYFINNVHTCDTFNYVLNSKWSVGGLYL